MSRTFAKTLLALGVLTLGLGTLAAQERPVERIIRKVDEGASRIGAEIRQTFGQIREGVNDMSVGSRVYSRLHWDKALANDPIEVDVDPGSIVILRGAVATTSARGRAVQLAQDTVGVNQVVDQLTIAGNPNSAGNPTPAPPAR